MISPGHRGGLRGPRWRDPGEARGGTGEAVYPRRDGVVHAKAMAGGLPMDGDGYKFILN